MVILNRTLIFIILSLFVSACMEDEPVPIPQTSFSVEVKKFTDDKAIFDVTDVIRFNNTSEGAIRYEWDFGDGSISDLKNPEHKYSSYGTHLVKLKAYNAVGDFTEYELEIYIGQRYMYYLYFLATDNTLPENAIYFFGESDNVNNTYLLGIPNFSSVIPFGGFLEIESPFNDKDWFFLILDNNLPLDSFDDNDSLVYGTIFNPSKVDCEWKGNFGKIMLTKLRNKEGQIVDDYSYYIEFQLR